MTPFGDALAAANERVRALCAATPADETQRLLLEELRGTLEELHVADEALCRRQQELAEAAQSLEQERRRYLDLFELAPDAYLVTDRTHRIVESNRAAAALLARPARALIGKPLTSFVPRERRGALRRRLAELGEAPTVSSWQFDLVAQQGRPVPVSATVGLVVDAAGALRGRRWILRDETDWQCARRSFEEIESRYRAIVETAIDGILTIDAAGTVQSMNPAAARMLGYAPSEVIGSNVKMLMPAPWSEEHDAYLEHYLRTGERRIIGIGREVRARRKDGSTFAVRLAVSEYREGSKPRFVGTIHDISARKESEAALRRFEDMISATTDLMAFIDRDLVYRAVNDAFAQGFARPREGIVGHRCEEVLGEALFEEVRPAMEQCLAGTDVHYEHWRDLPGGGRRYLDVRYAPHRNEHGKVTGLVVDARDRTETRRLEEQAAIRLEELAHVARLSTMGELASGLSHELNQPLTAIASYCDGARRLLERGRADPQMLIETLTACTAQARRAGEIIRRLRALVRRRAPVREPVDVDELLQEVVQIVEGEAGRRRVVLSHEPCGALPRVRADRVQIEQVIINLVRNAIEAFDESDTAERRVILRAEPARADGVEVQVDDTGPGFPPEAAGTLFEPFYTTKPEGMGIGLSVCRTIIEAHGGRIEAGLRLGGGARLRFALPVDSRKAAP